MTSAGGVGLREVKMAACLEWLTQCCLPEDEKRSKERSREIDRLIAREKLQYQRTQKILLLGSGESGKSTFLKQMRIIHGQCFQETELISFKSVIYSNIVKGIKVLIDARDKLHIPWGDEQNSYHGQKVFSYDNNIKLDDKVFHEYIPSLNALWEDTGIRTAFDRRREFQLVVCNCVDLGDSVKYFLDNLDRIGSEGFVPKTKDVLHARKATKGIWECEFIIKGVPFRFVDVGGQRSQRQKWYQCFDSVTSILFLVSSSEFDQVLMEDRKTNRLVESASIFETIVNNKAFSNVSVILFLNKTDLLEDKIKEVSIKDYFPAFEGDPHKLEHVQKFELDLLDSKRRERSKPLFHHFTTAVDTENIKFVFQAVKDTILQHNLVSIMLQ